MQASFRKDRGGRGGMLWRELDQGPGTRDQGPGTRDQGPLFLWSLVPGLWSEARPRSFPCVSQLAPAATSAPASVNPFRTLGRHRNFRLFWFGQTLSLIGTWMQGMAEGWLALELSNSAFIVGLVASAQSIPILVLSLHAGVIVD